MEHLQREEPFSSDPYFSRDMADQSSTSLQDVSSKRPRILYGPIKEDIKFEFSLPIAIAIIDTNAAASQNMVELKEDIKQEPLDEINDNPFESKPEIKREIKQEIKDEIIDEISEESIIADNSIYTDLYMMNEIEVMEDVCSTEFLENLPAGAQSEIATNTAASENHVEAKKANFFDEVVGNSAEITRDQLVQLVLKLDKDNKTLLTNSEKEKEFISELVKKCYEVSSLICGSSEERKDEISDRNQYKNDTKFLQNIDLKCLNEQMNNVKDSWKMAKNSLEEMNNIKVA